MRRDVRAAVLPWAAVILATAGYAVVAALRFFDDDEFQHVHISWLIHRGILPFRDFFEHHIPLYHLAISPLFGAGNGVWPVFAVRGVGVLCAAAVLALVHRYCRREDGPLPAVSATIMLAAVPMFLAKMVEARPEPPAILLLTAASLRLFGRRDGGKPSPAVAAILGAMAATAVLFSQKYIFAAFGLFLFALLVHGAGTAAVFLLGGAAACAPFALWLRANGIMEGFVASVIVNNTAWKHRFSPQGYLFEAFRTAGPLFALAAAAIVRNAAARTPASVRCLGVLAVAGAGLLGVMTVPEPYRQSFLPLFPVMAVAASALLAETAAACRAKTGFAAAWALLLAAALAPAAAALSADLRTSNAADLATIRLVERLDPAGGPVFDGRGLLFHRMHVGRHACMHRGIMMMIDPERFAADTVAALEKARYPVVILDYRVAEMPLSLLSFIRSRYVEVSPAGVMMPGLTVDRSVLTFEGTDVDIPVGGIYRVSWIGQELAIDDAEIAQGSEIRLDAGVHRMQALGFVDRLALVLVKRL